MIAIEFYLYDEFAIVNADPLKIEHILMNLTIKTKDAIPQEGGKPIIATTTVTLDPE